jgi:membrane-bound serine protease (ClpP class)
MGRHERLRRWLSLQTSSFEFQVDLFSEHKVIPLNNYFSIYRLSTVIVRHGLCLALVLVVLLSTQKAAAQDAAEQPGIAPQALQESVTPTQDSAKQGSLIDVRLPITARTASTVVETLETVAKSGSVNASGVSRVTVVLRYRSDESDGAATLFEDALKLARALSRPEFRQLRIVSFVDGAVKGHAVLPILASDLIVITDGASLSDAAIGEPDAKADETIVAAYLSVAARRGLFAPALVEVLVRPGQELVLATTIDGKRRFAAGDELVELRRDGGGWQEEVWAAPGQSLVLTADRMRSSRIASHVVKSLDASKEVLDLAELKPIASQLIGVDIAAGLLEVSGAISSDRVRRWELNLAKASDAGELNTVIVAIDSSGGDLESSLQLAGTLSSAKPPIKKAIGYIENQSRGDSLLIAIGCKPLYMHPDAKLGGPGGQSIDDSDLRSIAEAIEQVASDTGRPIALVRGLLDPSLRVFRYTNTKTGQIRYATEDELALGSDEPDAERRLWRRGDLIALENGLSANDAILLGLAEEQAGSLEELSLAQGLSESPRPITDRGLIHFVEWIGGMKGVSILLLMIGMVALSIEAGTPGVSVPGFVALLCFAFYFWIQFLNGTAQWLEVLAFALGLLCIGVELFLLPGLGIFGIGGMCLLVLGVVLTSQTFVIPRNTYQFEQLTRSLWLVVGGFGSIIVGLVLVRLMLPQQTIFKHLALESPDNESIDRAERLADFEYLLGAPGVATTPLRPAGKARFGDEVVQVISDGTPLAAGDAVRVIEVRGNRIVVAAVE